MAGMSDRDGFEKFLRGDVPVEPTTDELLAGLESRAAWNQHAPVGRPSDSGRALPTWIPLAIVAVSVTLFLAFAIVSETTTDFRKTPPTATDSGIPASGASAVGTNLREGSAVPGVSSGTPGTCAPAIAKPQALLLAYQAAMDLVAEEREAVCFRPAVEPGFDIRFDLCPSVKRIDDSL